ncbi:type IX secretion system membrane protein PorP/SprF [Paradesertivirga mongoliensis]|uniref:Type IX secretion system membrane protein PorP/SprF n=1 Tax=Paradesertivirga mongoliensis TaxID=2100740 RepID=A0ABW4ZPZ9_9SPHI|nr:type IX secretion system membrane protein PorP/SprF [Pedobacter mongoliensis]
MKKLIFICLQIISLHGFTQQKAIFSQYMFNPVLINPAYPAVDESINITTVVRQQWQGFAGAPNTQTFSVHSPLGRSNTFIGITAFRDHIGEAITETGGFFTLAQRVKINSKTYLSLGVNGGLSQYAEDYSRISSPVDLNDDPLFADQDQLRANFGAGLMLFSDKFYLGLSSPFLYIQDYENNHSPFVTLQGGYILPLGDAFVLKPNILGRYVSGSPLQLDLNLNLLIKERLGLGVSYRSMDSIDFLAKLYITRTLCLGYAYDYSITKLASSHNGSHELMLNLRLPLKGREFSGCYYF